MFSKLEFGSPIPENIKTSLLNRNKNRYSNIHPNDSSRVVLNTPSSYINGSLISFHSSTKTYIATQAPLKSTEYDFWLMLISYNSSQIFCLSNPIEDNKEKGLDYWGCIDVPRRVFNDYNQDYIEILLKSQQDLDFKIVERVFLIKFNHVEYSITQFHYTGWPDFNVIPVSHIEALTSKTIHSNAPITVHCSAGVGRSGVFIACDVLDCGDDIFDIVTEMRISRPGMVQTRAQYELIEEYKRSMKEP